MWQRCSAVVADDSVVFDAAFFLCYKYCFVVSSHCLSRWKSLRHGSLVYTVNTRKITTLLLQRIRYTFFCQTLCTKRDKAEPPEPETAQKHKSRKYLKRRTNTPRKEDRKHVQQYWHRESPRSCWNVEAIRKWNKLPSEAKQHENGPKTPTHKKKLEFTKRRVTVRAGVPQQWFGGPRGVKMLPPYDNCISAGHLACGKKFVFKAGIFYLTWASLKRGRL